MNKVILSYWYSTVHLNICEKAKQQAERNVCCYANVSQILPTSIPIVNDETKFWLCQPKDV